MAAVLGPKQTWQIASAWFLPWHQSSCAGTNIDPVQMILWVWHQFGHSIIHIKCPSVQSSLSLLTHCTEKSDGLSIVFWVIPSPMPGICSHSKPPSTKVAATEPGSGTSWSSAAQNDSLSSVSLPRCLAPNLLINLLQTALGNCCGRLHLGPLALELVRKARWSRSRCPSFGNQLYRLCAYVHLCLMYVNINIYIYTICIRISIYTYTIY